MAILTFKVTSSRRSLSDQKLATPETLCGVTLFRFSWYRWILLAGNTGRSDYGRLALTLFLILLGALQNSRLRGPKGVCSEHQYVVMHGSESLASSCTIRVPFKRLPNLHLLPF